MKIVAVSENKNQWGHWGVILVNHLDQYFEVSSSRKMEVGEELYVSRGEGHYGYNWARAGVEYPCILRDKQEDELSLEPVTYEDTTPKYLVSLEWEDAETTSVTGFRTNYESKMQIYRYILCYYCGLLGKRKPDRIHISEV
jgi:hypothetical protein